MFAKMYFSVGGFDQGLENEVWISVCDFGKGVFTDNASKSVLFENVQTM